MNEKLQSGGWVRNRDRGYTASFYGVSMTVWKVESEQLWAVAVGIEPPCDAANTLAEAKALAVTIANNERERIDRRQEASDTLNTKKRRG